MDNRIEVTAKRVYGQTLLYPTSPQATRLADLVGTRTLTVGVLSHARAMGFEIHVTGDMSAAERAIADITGVK